MCTGPAAVPAGPGVLAVPAGPGGAPAGPARRRLCQHVPGRADLCAAAARGRERRRRRSRPRRWGRGRGRRRRHGRALAPPRVVERARVAGVSHVGRAGQRCPLSGNPVSSCTAFYKFFSFYKWSCLGQVLFRKHAHLAIKDLGLDRCVRVVKGVHQMLGEQTEDKAG